MKTDLIFNENQKVISLSLEELESTSDYRGVKKHELSHHELFRQIMTDLTGRGYDASMKNLFVSKTGAIYPTQKEIDQRGYLTSINDIRGVIVNTVIGSIDLNDKGLNDGGTNHQIAASFNKSGIQLSMGTNIQICSNFSIFGGQMMQNYGSTGMPFMRMLDILASWIQNMRKYRMRDLEVIKVLSNTEIDPIKEVDQVVGNLHRLVEMNKKDSKIMAPLTHSRIHDLQRGMMDYGGKLTTANDFYQASTDISGKQSVIENRLSNTADLGSYFTERYGCVMDVEFDEVVENVLV